MYKPACLKANYRFRIRNAESTSGPESFTVTLGLASAKPYVLPSSRVGLSLARKHWHISSFHSCSLQSLQ